MSSVEHFFLTVWKSSLMQRVSHNDLCPLLSSLCEATFNIFCNLLVTFFIFGMCSISKRGHILLRRSGSIYHLVDENLKVYTFEFK